MKNFLKFRFDLPGTTESEIQDILGNCGSIKAEQDSVLWTTPYQCLGEEREFIIQQSDTPFVDSDISGRISIRHLKDSRCLTDLNSEGGILRVLCEESKESVVLGIETKLLSFREALDKESTVYVFAAHLNGVKCAEYCRNMGLVVRGFIDNDKKKQGNKFHGYDVFSLSDVDHDALIINASGRYCVEINQQLISEGYAAHIDFMEFLFLFNLPFQAEEKFRNYVTSEIENRAKLVTLYLAMADEESRRVLDEIIKFRLTLNSEPTKEITSNYDEEFFAKDVLTFESDEVFVDGGAYDGDSFLRFSEMSPSFKHAYLFEPDEEIYKKATLNLQQDIRVSICNCGLWSETTELFFSSTGGMDGALAEQGDIRVKVVAVDDFIRGKVTHIKLDVEGAEAEALNGTSKHIAEYHPKIAIALYHRAEDLWKLPAQIESLGGHYRYYLRHYSQTIDDSIIYALPVI